MIIVTGGAGMIGSNIIKALNNRGHTNILVVDNLKDGTKFYNLVDLNIIDYIDKKTFMTYIMSNRYFDKTKVVFHEGACSKTTNWNGRYIMENNYQYSKNLLDFCINKKIPFLYASSAAVYGNSKKNFIEERQYEHPINIYGYSKFLFDHYVRKVLLKNDSPICGLRYFNVYGPRETHKGSMASFIFNCNQQISNEKTIEIFHGSDEFRRDFVHVDDVIDLNLWCWEKRISGIYNCGTSYTCSFSEIANLVIKFHQKGKVEYIPFPKILQGRYQKFTQANLTNLYRTGYNKQFKLLSEGINNYLVYINQEHM